MPYSSTDSTNYTSVHSPSVSIPKKSDFSTLAVIGSVFVFLGSIGYAALQTQNQSTSTKAAPVAVHVPAYKSLSSSLFASVLSYPKKFNGQIIDQTVFAEGENKYKDVQNKTEVNIYINTIVGTYYSYQNMLLADAAASIPKVTFDEMEQSISDLEFKTIQNSVNHSDFYFVYARYNSSTKTKEKAVSLVSKYEKKLQTGVVSPERLIWQANNDVDLKEINTPGDSMQFIQNYTTDNNFTVAVIGKEDIQFNTMLFSAKETEFYTYDIPDQAVILLYPSAVKTDLKYDSLQTLLTDSKKLFEF